LGAVIAPVVGLMGNDEIALAVVMTAGVAIALLALLTVGTGDDKSAQGDSR
jgi:DHA1 family bicyclomycin/chloramphenicol resistance-like MFS transporter